MLGSRALRQDGSGVRCFRVFVGESRITAPWCQWTVDCPRRGRLGLEHCADCASFVGLRVLPRRAGTLVACRFEEPRPELSKPRAPAAVLASTPVSALLVEDVLCLSPELPIDEVATLLVAKSLPCAPVVDDLRRPLGLVSKRDLTHLHGPGPGRTRKALRDVMRPLLSISVDSVAGDAVEAMWSNGVDCLAVVTASGRLEGVLSAVELLRCLVAAPHKPESRR